jgi:hypothetical protein
MSETEPQIIEFYVFGFLQMMKTKKMSLDEVYDYSCKKAISTEGQENLPYIKAAYEKLKKRK